MNTIALHFCKKQYNDFFGIININNELIILIQMMQIFDTKPLEMSKNINFKIFFIESESLNSLY